jgi:pentatricopeptide repeat protein
MVKDYGIEPENRHYVCMVDALGRSGRLREAESFINNMHIKPDALVWGTLLAACKIHGEVELGKVAAKKAIELEPSDAGAYISLSNILAEVGEWDEVEETRKLMKGTGVQKEPGWSSV